MNKEEVIHDLRVIAEYFTEQSDGCVPLCIVEAIKALEGRPTGEWKCFIGSAYYGVDEDNEPIWRERKIYHCSKCNRRTVIKENYCPNCGAKMEGGRE